MAYNKETGMWEGYIYKIVNDVNDIVYIGQTITTLRNRFYGHKSTAKNKPFSCIFASAIHKYGIEHFNIIEIDRIEHKDKKCVQDKLNQLEIQYIADFKANGIELYNMTIGGDSQGNTWPEKPVIQYDLFCNEVNRFNSVVGAGNLTGTSHSDISSCCSKNGKIYKANNYIWRFDDEPLTKDEVQMYNKRYPGICQYDFDGNLINTFYTIKDAQNYLNTIGLKGLNITACCNGKCKSVEGFVWRYKKDSFDKYALPEKHRMVEQRDKETGELIAKYNSCKEASDKTGFDKSCINQCCIGNNHYSNGYIWCYEGDSFEINYKKQYLDKRIAVDMYSLDKKYIRTYDSITNASIDTGVDHHSISRVCKNLAYVAGEYIWRYHGEDISTYIDKPVYKKTNIQQALINGSCEIEYRDFKTGKIIKVYGSVKEASDDTGIDYKIISKQCNFTYFEKYGLHGLWCIKGYYSKKLLENFYSFKIDMYDLKGNLINTFNTLSDCLDFIKFYDSNHIVGIKETIEGKRLSLCGYVWRKHGDSFDVYNQYNNILIYDINLKLVYACNKLTDAASYCNIKYSQAYKSIKDKVFTNGYILFYKNEDVRVNKDGKFIPIIMYDSEYNYVETFNYKKDIYNRFGVEDDHRRLNNAIKNNTLYNGYYFKLAVA